MKPFKTTLKDAIADLPADAAEVFRDLQSHEDYSCRALRMQMTVHFRGEKVGGLNRMTSEWYVSRVFAADHHAADILSRHEFERLLKKPDHEYWGRKGPGSAMAFRSAVQKITGVVF